MSYNQEMPFNQEMPLDQVTYIPETWTHANCYIIHGEKDILIDPGIDFDPHIARNLAALFATHFHYDHINQVPVWRKRCKADFYMPKSESLLLKDTEANCSKLFGVPTSFDEPDYYFTDQQVFYQDAQIRFTAYHLPGHSPGCSAMLVERYTDSKHIPLVLISGDVLFADSIGRTDLKGGNPSAMRESLKRLVKIMRGLPTDLPVLPGHGSPFTISDAFRYNPYLFEFSRD